MASTSRQKLKAKFVSNAVPTEQDFKDLIDAPLNQNDDGIFRNPGESLCIVARTDAQMLANTNEQKRALGFFGDATAGSAQPDWLISLNPGPGSNNPGFGIADRTGDAKLFIDASGKVGIGTNNPGAGLDINKGSTNEVALRCQSSGRGWGSGLQLKNTAPGGRTFGIYSGADGRLHVADHEDRVDRLIIDKSGNIGIDGNIGIGGANPISAQLQFDNSIGNKILFWDGGAADRYGFGLSGGNLNAFIPSRGRFSIRQNDSEGTEVLTIDGSGNLAASGNLTAGQLAFSGTDWMIRADDQHLAIIKIIRGPGIRPRLEEVVKFRWDPNGLNVSDRVIVPIPTRL
jgi:hypothetical protein